MTKKKTVYVNRELNQLLHKQVTHTDGSEFQKIDLQDSSKPVQQCYCFRDDKAVNKPVQILVDFITENNLVFELEDAKEFLITTIGEIFRMHLIIAMKIKYILCMILIFKREKYS